MLSEEEQPSGNEDMTASEGSTEAPPDVSKIDAILEGAIERDRPEVAAVQPEKVEDAAEETKPAAPPVAPTAQEFDPQILQLAAFVGLDEGAARGFGSVQALENFLRAHPSYAERGPQAAPPAVGFKLEGLDLSSDEFDPHIVKMAEMMKGMNEYYGGRLQDLEHGVQARFAQWEQKVQTEDQERQASWFEGQMKTLPEETTGLLDDERQLNMAYYIKSRQDGLRLLTQSGVKLPIPSREDLFQESVRVVLGDKLAEIERKKISDSLLKQQKTMLTRPTQRKGPSLESEDAASLQKVNNILGEARDREGLS